MIYRRGVRGIWWIRFRFAGRMVHESTRSTSKEVAKDVERKRRREEELNINGLQARQRRVCFAEFAAKFAAWASETKIGWAQYRGKPPEQTTAALKAALEFFGHTPLREITKDRVKDFGLSVAQRSIGGRPVKNRTVNGYLKDLRHMFNKAIEWGDAASNPVARFQFANEGRQKSAGRILESEAEQAKLLAELPAWLRLLAELGLQTGARRGDLVKLTWESVHPDYIEFLETKECKHREVPLNGRAQEILTLLRAPSVSPDAFVFEPDVPRGTLIWRIRREWKRAIIRSGIAKIRFHDLRHTVGTRLVRSAVDLRTVQGILGHASLKTTERYLHSSDKLKQQAVEKLADYGREPVHQNVHQNESAVSSEHPN